MSADPILSVIEAIYDAALDETLWTKALAALTAVTGSQAATFWVLDSSGHDSRRSSRSTSSRCSLRST